MYGEIPHTSNWSTGGVLETLVMLRDMTAMDCWYGLRTKDVWLTGTVFVVALKGDRLLTLMT